MKNDKRRVLTKSILSHKTLFSRNKPESPKDINIKRTTFSNFSKNSKMVSDAKHVKYISVNKVPSTNKSANITVNLRCTTGKLTPMMNNYTNYDMIQSQLLDKTKNERILSARSKLKSKSRDTHQDSGLEKDNSSRMMLNRNMRFSLSNSVSPRNPISIYMSPQKKITNQTYYYIIKPQNCGKLVQKCFEHRINWQEGYVEGVEGNISPIFNFKWQQNKYGIDYSSLSKNPINKQMVNHYEFNSSITNKGNIFINLMRYCERKDDEVFKYVPFTILFLYQHTNFIQKYDNFVELFTHIKYYLQSMDEMSKKKLTKRLMYNIAFPFQDKLGYKTTISIPTSHFNNKNLWLIKAPDLNRGHCIKLVNSTNQMLKNIKQFYEGVSRGYSSERSECNPYENNIKKVYSSEVVIVQKYIEKPMLYYGRKFDIRLWVILTHKFQVFVFKEGHLKTCSIKYNINTLNTFGHLTNYSLQKYNENFSKFEHGNEVSFDEFQAYLDKFHPDKKIDFKNTLFIKIKQIIEMSFYSVKTKINSLDRKYCFEVFGYDFMLDEDFNPFLIEINMNPGLEESSPLIKMLVPRMIDDALRITVDDLFKTKYSFGTYDDEEEKNGSKSVRNEDYISPYPVDNYSNSENLWDKICDLNLNEDSNKSVSFKFRYKMHFGARNIQLG